jgi:hypothetical protein
MTEVNQYIEPDSALHKARLKMSELFGQVQSIDRLMRDKVEDYVLIEELPLPIRIGNKTIFIGTFNLENDYVFFREYAKLMSRVGMRTICIDLLGDSLQMFEYLKLHKKLHTELCKIIGKTILRQQFLYYADRKKTYKLNKCSWRYFRKYCDVQKLLQICNLIWLFNYDAEKKNFKLVAQRMGITAPTETYIYTWLKNSAGLTGKYVAAQRINVDYWQDEQQSSTPAPTEGLN